MRQYKNQQPQSKESIFGNAFNLHPLDCITFLQTTYQHMREFVNGFKQRIQAEIEYSKTLIKVSKTLSKHVNTDRSSPISYISSAFKVQNELRARHALQLAQYLHTEIEVPCEQLLQESEYKLKQAIQDLKRIYKQGQNTEQTYQKQFKKYYQSRQEWQQHMISHTILPYIPGIAQNQIQRSNARMLEQTEQNTQLFSKYMASLDTFNNFARRFNETAPQIVTMIEKESKKQLTLESNSLRKLIISEINMFKNIQYDLINISKQMENIQPKDQLQFFLEEKGRVFTNPIVSIYSQGPIIENSQDGIDFKYPITCSLLQKTLLRIESNHFTWMMQNKRNSTLQYSLAAMWSKFQGKQGEYFVEDLQECIVNNKAVKQIPMDNKEKGYYLDADQAFSVSFSIVTTLASFIRPVQLSQAKQAEIIQLLRKQLSLHHFYRFFATISLQQFLNIRENLLTQKIEEERLVMIIKLLIEQSVAAKDIFVIRLILAIMFSTELGTERVTLYRKDELLDFDIWSRYDFWESTLFQATYEEITLLPSVSKVALKEIYLMRQKNIVFSTLATYCHYMVMLECDVKQVRDIAGRFCHIYELYDEHERDLVKMIKASSDKLANLTQKSAQMNNQGESSLFNVNLSEAESANKSKQLNHLQQSNHKQNAIYQLLRKMDSSSLEQQNQEERSTNQNLQFEKSNILQQDEEGRRH